MPTLQDSYEECRQLNAYYGTPFYYALNLFPKNHQPHLQALCAFSRIITRLVHHPNEGVSKTKQKQALRTYLNELKMALESSHSDDLYLQAIVHTAKFYDIPYDDFRIYANQMLKNLDVKEYATYASLQTHLDRCAGTLGKMMAHIIGGQKEKAYAHAAKLARAGHLLELICDAGKEYDLNKRIYLAQSDLKKFGCTAKHFKEQKATKKWRTLIEHYLQKIEADVAYAQKGLKHFHSDTHRALHATTQIYLGLVDSIRRMDYNIFRRRPDVSWAHKVRCALPF